MSPHLLPTFVSVARHLSFTRAADELLLSQPAISRQIAQLEQEVGGPLFERLGRTVHLTNAGRTLLPLAEQILGQILRAREAVRGQTGATIGPLRIGASTTPGLYLLPPILAEFQRKHPEAELSFQIQNSLDIEQRVLSNELDLGLTGARLVHKALHTERIADDELVCICNPDHALARRQRVTPKALEDYPWIQREPGSATGQLVQRWLRRVRITVPRVMAADSPEAVKALVQAGLGIAFISSHAVSCELRSGRLKRIHLPQVRLIRPIFLVRHPDKHETPAMRSLLDMMPAHPS